MYSDDFRPVSPAEDPVDVPTTQKSLQAPTHGPDGVCAASVKMGDPVSAADQGVCSPCTDPSFPIFFPTYSPIFDGFQKQWWWYDPSLMPDDQGPYESRDAASDAWGMTCLADALACNAAAIQGALDSLKILPPAEPDPDHLIAQLDALDVALDAPLTIPPDDEARQPAWREHMGCLSLIEDLKRGEVVRLAEQGMAILTSAGPADRALLAGMEIGRFQGVGTVLGRAGA